MQTTFGKVHDKETAGLGLASEVTFTQKRLQIMEGLKEQVRSAYMKWHVLFNTFCLNADALPDCTYMHSLYKIV